MSFASVSAKLSCSSLRGRTDEVKRINPGVRKIWALPLLDNYLVNFETPFVHLLKRERQGSTYTVLITIIM